MSTGKSVARVDAFDKVTGRARYTDDLCDRSALVARVLHSTIANGVVKRIDTSLAEQIEGVVKIVTCFDVPDFLFPTAGTPVVDRPAPSGRGRPQAPDGPRPLLRRRRGGGHRGKTRSPRRRRCARSTSSTKNIRSYSTRWRPCRTARRSCTRRIRTTSWPTRL